MRFKRRKKMREIKSVEKSASKDKQSADPVRGSKRMAKVNDGDEKRCKFSDGKG